MHHLDPKNRGSLPAPHRRLRPPQPGSPTQQTPHTAIDHTEMSVPSAILMPEGTANRPDAHAHPHTRLQEEQYETPVPTVADRIAQTVVARRLEAKVQPIFHPDSYGYRPARSALDAVAACRKRCWRKDWVIDLDIAKFFDSVPWDLIVKAVEKHTDQPWVVLYVKRWLAAPLVLPDGNVQQRDRGTPQGSAVSPVLANLFMHYAFDDWMAREYPSVPFERYCDDAVVHCVSERQAHRVRAARSRVGVKFTSFLPAISKQALKKISGEVRRWRLHRKVPLTITELAKKINPIIRGWTQYYGA